jgi:uncharacterized protein YbbC (DUF1343 family)
LSGTTVAWKTTWKWVGGNGVKSYTNMQLNSGLNKKLSAISSIPVSCTFASLLEFFDNQFKFEVDMELVPVKHWHRRRICRL